MFTDQDFFILLAVAIAINVVILFIPLIIILRRMGLSGWWVLFLFVPFVGIAGPWVLALARWPALDTSSAKPS